MGCTCLSAAVPDISKPLIEKKRVPIALLTSLFRRHCKQGNFNISRFIELPPRMRGLSRNYKFKEDRRSLASIEGAISL